MSAELPQTGEPVAAAAAPAVELSAVTSTLQQQQQQQPAAAVVSAVSEAKDDGYQDFYFQKEEAEGATPNEDLMVQVSHASSLHPIQAVMRRQHLLANAPKEGTLANLLSRARDTIVEKHWHLLEVREVQRVIALPDLNRGLDQAEVASRRLAFGDNRLAEAKGRTVLGIIVSHFVNPITFILGCVFAIAVVNEEWVEAVAVVLIVFFNSGVGAKQEIDSEKAMAAIRKLGGALSTTVIRSGRTKDVPVEDLVIGDVVEVRQGDQLPADLRLVAVSHFEVDESVLTGESIPVAKITQALIPDEEEEKNGVAVGDRINVAFRQTAVTQGYGKGIVVAVGPNSQMGRIATRLSQRSGTARSPVLVSMDRLMFLLLFIGIVFGFFIVMAFDWTVDSTSLLYASATLVAILPEAALVLITVAMALGSYRMSQNHAIVRKMQALEMLGKVTDVCSDKTGTLTQGKMRPSRVVFFDKDDQMRELSLVGPALNRTTDWFEGNVERRIDLAEYLQEIDSASHFNSVLMVCSLCSSTMLEIDESDGVSLIGSGNPTEVALQELVHKAAASLIDEQGHWPGEEVDGNLNISSAAAADAESYDAAVAASVAPLRPHLSTGRHSMRALQRRQRQNMQEETVGPIAIDLGLQLRDDWEFKGEWGFDSTVKRMSTGWRNRDSGRSIVLVKGAPEKILPLCTMSAEAADGVAAKVQSLARLGLRVLGLARRDDVDLRHCTLPDIDRDQVETNLRFIGLVGVRDPPKNESKTAVRMCMSAGITVRMLTGDHLDTAFAISKEIGILPPEADLETLPDGVVISGPRLDNMTDEELDALEELPLVVARSSPESKVKVVEALHRRKRIVAMTGDGVNDSPSISEADVGIAMGITGSDVTKGVADIVLADDNFATIISAIREGRRIFDAIVKFVLFLLTSNVAEAVALMISLGFITGRDNMPVVVLSPIAILCVNTITGFGPSIGLALDAESPDLMRRPPVNHGLFTKEIFMDMTVMGGIIGALSLLSFWIVSDVIYDGDLGLGCNTTSGDHCSTARKARAAAFLTLNILLLVDGYTCRHFRLSAFAQSWTENRVMLGGFIGGILLMFPILYIPGFNTEVFKHEPSGWEWPLALGSVVVFQVCAELYKWLKRRFMDDLSRLAGKTPNALVCKNVPRKNLVPAPEPVQPQPAVVQELAPVSQQQQQPLPAVAPEIKEAEAEPTYVPRHRPQISTPPSGPTLFPTLSSPSSPNQPETGAVAAVAGQEASP